jgi:uncharacterized membrane protein YqiK
MTEERKVRPDAKIEDIQALMELNRREAEAMQEGMRKKKAEAIKVANTASSLHGDKHLDGVFDQNKQQS